MVSTANLHHYIEGPGWEPSLVFAGLGMSRGSKLGIVNGMEWTVTDTGEGASVHNLALACRNQMQAYCLVVVAGDPRFFRCDMRGGAWVGGRAPPGQERG